MVVKLSSSVVESVKRFRETFQHVGKDVLNYFPGHMAKGLKQMQNTLKRVDCIVEVHDARIPFSGRNPRFQDSLMVRPHLLILNKMDLANMGHHKRIEAAIKADGVQNVFYTCCREDLDQTIKFKLLPAVIEMIESVDRYNRAEEEDFNVLIIGIPNVGKSSLINALRRMHLKKGGKATPVGARPGVTRSVMEKIKVSDKPKVYVFDTPGIMVPNIPNMEVGMKLALCATLKDHLVGVETVADYMLFWLNKHSHFKYVKHFGMNEPTDDIYLLLTHVAKENNLILKTRSMSGGYVFRPHFSRAAELVLRDFRSGCLGKVNLDEDVIDLNCAQRSDTAIVLDSS